MPPPPPPAAPLRGLLPALLPPKPALSSVAAPIAAASADCGAKGLCDVGPAGERAGGR
jgi:hypothetical protein